MSEKFLKVMCKLCLRASYADTKRVSINIHLNSDDLNIPKKKIKGRLDFNLAREV